MRRNLALWLVGILLLTILAGYVDLNDKIGFGDFTKDVHTRKGLDLEGGLQLVLQAEARQAGGSITPDQLNAARNIVEDRANSTGANEPVVQTAGGDRILVELPGIQDLESATRIIQETAFLEIVDGGSNPPTTNTFITTTLGPPRTEQLHPGGLTAGTTVSGTQTITNTAATPQVSQPDRRFETIVTGDDLDSSKVSVVFNPTTNAPEVAFTLKGDGANKFATFTTNNVGKFMPILLDKRVINAPVIQSAIIGGSGVINGLSNSEARVLATQLKYGALPVALRPLESRKISATLGEEAINRSLIAGIVGLGLVVLFMMAYYRLPGVVASVALMIYSALAYAIFRFVPVTLTLAGIAGFILSIGMAVDANVLIFARLKDELRSGKTLAAAVEAGFDHAWPSIRDSNASTLITCGILYWFGSTFGGASIIKGFALTLAIGVIVSLFTAVTVTRTFLRAIVPTALSRSKWAFFLEGRKQPAALPTTTAASTTEA